MMENKNPTCFTCSQNILNECVNRNICLKQLCKILKIPTSILTNFDFFASEFHECDITKVKTIVCNTCFELLNNADMICKEIENLEADLSTLRDKIKNIMTSNCTQISVNSTQLSDPSYSIRKSFVQCFRVPTMKLEGSDEPQIVQTGCFEYLNSEELRNEGNKEPTQASVTLSSNEENSKRNKVNYCDSENDGKNEQLTSSEMAESTSQSKKLEQNNTFVQDGKMLQNISSSIGLAYQTSTKVDESQNCDESGRYKCTKCNKKFKNYLTRDIHIKRIHQGDLKPYECSVCKWKFASPSKLAAHAKARAHTQESELEEKFQVEDAGDSSCVSKDNLEIKASSSLLSSVSKEGKGYTCPLSSYSKSKRGNVNDHQKTYRGKNRPFVCVWCQPIHAQPTDRDSETTGDTTAKQMNIEAPSIAPSTFSTEKKLRLHILTKHQNNKCQECNRNFKSPYMLERHLASHTTTTSQEHSKAKFICEICGTKYSALKRLKVHQMRHANNTEPYACGKCGKAFSEPRTLQVHRASVHDQIFKYHCKVCGVGCQQIYMLKRHMLCHTAEKNYECSTCHLKFKRKPQLIIHERKHTGEKPFQCLLCSKAFTEKKKLKNHETLHMGEKPFKCTLEGCSKAFALKHYLTHHINTTHKNKQPKVDSNPIHQQQVELVQHQPPEHEVVLESLEEAKFVSVEFISNDTEEQVQEAIVYATENGELEVVGEWIGFGFVHTS